MGYREQLEAGHGAFAAMIKAWHERNGWSHRVLPALAELLDFGRLHSSQISNLRNRKLSSPGPEVFLALGSCNRWLSDAAAAGVLTAEAQQQLADQQELELPCSNRPCPCWMPARPWRRVNCWRFSWGCDPCRRVRFAHQ